MFRAPFSFNGRIRRLEYGLSLLIYTPCAFFLSILGDTTDSMELWLVLALYVPLIWFLWAQGAKRCHDRGNSGFFVLIPFYMLVLLFGEGDHYKNKYGRNPKTGLDEAEAEPDFFEEEPISE